MIAAAPPADVPVFNRMLEPGEPVPWFRTAILGASQDYAFERLGGRHLLMFLFGSASVAPVQAGLQAVANAARLFDGDTAMFIGVTIDAADVSAGRLGTERTGIHFITDNGREASRLFGAAAEAGTSYRPHWLLVDPALRVVARFGLNQAEQAIAALAEARARPPADTVPVLQIGQVLEPELCRHLIGLYEQHGGIESGVMRQVGGRTVGVIDHSMKSRADYDIADPALREAISARVKRRLVPMIQRAFQFEATRIERYIVACYDAASNGRFNAHRDNTTLGTAHRRFAVTINLNDDYDGGDLRFPEWGPRTYRAPVGGAVVFSCSMLHEATPVLSGRRFATLPFLYDEPAAIIRQANLHSLVGEGAPAA